MEEPKPTIQPIANTNIATENGKVVPSEKVVKKPKGPTKFGMFQGVFTPTLLTHSWGYHVLTWTLGSG